MIGQTILHYRVEKKLGEGGMGAVYLAENTRLHQRVALKFLPPQFSDDPELKARLEREAVAAAALSHPNIVTVHDLHEYEGQPFIAMEYLEGSDLATWCKDQNPSMEEMLDVVIQIGEGLKKAHEAGIVHRDLKPTNIMVDRDGRAKILDFGLAKLKGATKVTATGSTMGTARYMSPEQGQGLKVDHRTDLWSLGVILYELIARHLPFDADHEAAVAYTIAHEEPEPLARYKAGVSDELQRIVRKCLAKDPSERYQSAADLVADLKRLGKSSTPIQRSRRKLWIVAAAALLLAIGAYILVEQWRRSEGHVEDGWSNSIAVLVFRNLSADTEQDYFCEGMTDEIIGQLSSIEELKVTSMQSVLRFKGSDLDLKEIGKKLGVTHILDGSVQQVEDSLRVRAQLIRVDDDAHIWSERYDHSRDTRSIFAIQDAISHAISDQMELALTGVVAAQRTESLDAYTHYLRGLTYVRDMTFASIGNIDLALQQFQDAANLDPSFAAAVAELSRMHSLRHWFSSILRGEDRPQPHTSLAWTFADSAVRLDPQSAASHFALGEYYYRIEGEYDDAAAALQQAFALKPNSWDIALAQAAVARRRGDWLLAYSQFARAVELAPLSVFARINFIINCEYMRRYDESLESIAEAISLFPDETSLYVYWARVLDRTGRSEEALEVLAEAEIRIEGASFNHGKSRSAYLLGDFNNALKWEAAAHTRGDSLLTNCLYYYHTAPIFFVMGDVAQSTHYLDSALECLQASASTDSKLHDSTNTMMRMATVLAFLGKSEEAVQLGESAYRRMPVEDDHVYGVDFLLELCYIYILVGKLDKACDLVEELLSRPSMMSTSLLMNHPIYSRLKSHPRYKALLDRGHTVF